MTVGLVLLWGVIVCLVAQSVEAAELKTETSAAFERYIGASEKRIESELQNGPFLFIDELPEARRAEAYAELRRGTVLVKPVNTLEEGHPIEVKHGLIHDWIGVLFVPNASLSQTLAVVQDYDNYQNFYKPEMRRSKLLSHNGDNSKVFIQLYWKSLVTVTINADFDVNYKREGTNRVVDRACATRLAEVKDVGQANEHEVPAADAHGYLWRLCDYWRFEERDGGVYIQLESIALSRGVPAGIAWLIDPLLRSIPRDILSRLLGATRAAIVNRGAKENSLFQPESRTSKVQSGPGEGSASREVLWPARFAFMPHGRAAAVSARAASRGSPHCHSNPPDVSLLLSQQTSSSSLERSS